MCVGTGLIKQTAKVPAGRIVSRRASKQFFEVGVTEVSSDPSAGVSGSGQWPHSLSQRRCQKSTETVLKNSCSAAPAYPCWLPGKELLNHPIPATIGIQNLAQKRSDNTKQLDKRLELRRILNCLFQKAAFASCEGWNMLCVAKFKQVSIPHSAHWPLSLPPPSLSLKQKAVGNFAKNLWKQRPFWSCRLLGSEEVVI